MRSGYIVNGVGDLDVVDHACVRRFLQHDELAASDETDVALAVADYEVRDDLVSR